MELTPREKDKLLLFTAALVAVNSNSLSFSRGVSSITFS